MTSPMQRGSPWRRFRRSPVGFAGAVLLLIFVTTAAAAPWIAPFRPEDTAPSIDILEAHSIAVDLPPGPWSSPRPVVDSAGMLEAVTTFSQDGRLLVLPVEKGRLELAFGAPRNVTLPASTRALDRVTMSPPLFLSWNGSAAVRWTDDLSPAGSPHEFDFGAQWASGPVVSGGLHAAAWSGEHGVALLAGRPAMGASFGETLAPIWWSSAAIDDARVVGAPLVLLLQERGNGTAAARGDLLVVPTDRDIRAYEITIARAGSRVTDVAIGPLAWRAEAVGLVPDAPIAFPTTTPDAFAKDRVVGVLADGRIVAVDRVDGHAIYTVKPYLRTARDATPLWIRGTLRGDLLVGYETAEGGALAAHSAATGGVAANHTALLPLPSPPASPPEYVAALKEHVFSTKHGTVLFIDDDLTVRASFSIPGGAATAIAYVGNVYSNVAAPQKGNYFATVTTDGRLFAQSTGNLRTPLPPGCVLLGVTMGATYPSGNCYLLGTDAYGHDILSWLVWGTRAELVVGISAATAAVLIGTIVGLVAGFAGGFLDDLLMRITDINLTLPALVIALLVVAMWGPSLLHVVLIIAFLSWSVTARVIRSQTLSLKERPFVNAARMSGAGTSRIIFRHLAPNVLPFAFLFLAFGVSGAIIVEALLAFLGFGDPSAITWGMMLQYLYISGHTLSAPWWLVPPGLAITALSLSFYLVGRAFDDVVNPRLRSR